MEDAKVGESSVERRVDAEIKGQAAVAPTGQARMHDVAGQIHDKAIDESVKGERVISHARTAARGSQFLDYGFYVVYTLLGIRLVLSLIGAHSSSGFVKFIAIVTAPFYAPFRGIVGSPSTEAGNTLAFPVIVAIGMWAILHVAINGLLRMVGTRKTQI